MCVCVWWNLKGKGPNQSYIIDWPLSVVRASVTLLCLNTHLLSYWADVPPFNSFAWDCVCMCAHMCQGQLDRCLLVSAEKSFHRQRPEFFHIFCKKPKYTNKKPFCHKKLECRAVNSENNLGSNTTKSSYFLKKNLIKFEKNLFQSRTWWHVCYRLGEEMENGRHLYSSGSQNLFFCCFSSSYSHMLWSEILPQQTN